MPPKGVGVTLLRVQKYAAMRPLHNRTAQAKSLSESYLWAAQKHVDHSAPQQVVVRQPMHEKVL